MAKYLKGEVYKTMIIPVLMHGAWTMTRKEKGLLERIEMRMLRWILGASLNDRKECYVIMVICKAPLTGGYSEALSA